MIHVKVFFRSGRSESFLVPITTTVVQFARQARQIDGSGIRRVTIDVPEKK